MGSIGKNKAAGVTIITVIYCIAAAAGVLVYGALSATLHPYLALLAADVVATVEVWGFGLIYRNVSVYDPYWSVAPPVMFTAWVFVAGWNLPVILLLTAVWYWGIRLTLNWAYTFKGLAFEDWRYTKYRKSRPAWIFHLINFFGLNMMPTLLVFLCMLPGFGLYGSFSANFFTWAGFAISVAAPTIQLVADSQIHRFREANPGQFCNVGLWKHGRHPNYFGEISMWWGIWVMYASIHGLDLYVLGPVAMTALFLFISIPMMEKRQLENKPGYAEYRKKTRILI